jgi:hypothetical protein
VTIAGRGSAQFLTDRGQRELPAWEVHAQGLRQPIWVLDPGTSERAWRPMGLAGHELAWHGSLAQLSKDGCTIALSFSVMADEHVIYPEAKVQFPGAKRRRYACGRSSPCAGGYRAIGSPQAT